MNPKGNKRNLQASQQGNTNAQKSGVYSQRRRDETAGEARKAMDTDLDVFLAEESLNALAESIGLCELLAQDIAQQGVTDRKGNPRRVVGTYHRTLQMRQALKDQIRAERAAAAAEARDAEPWSSAEGRRILRYIAHNYVSAPGASIKAIELLDAQKQEVDDNERAFYAGLSTMTDEELEVELEALLVPITTGKRLRVPTPPRELIRELASQESILGDDLHALYRSIAETLGLPTSRTGNPKVRPSGTEAGEDADQESAILG
jgi:hypothetical protein